MTNRIKILPFSVIDGPLYPVGLVVRGRPCLVVGGGRVAARKVASLLRCGAAVTIVAPEVHEALSALVAEGLIESIDGPPLHVQLRPYEAGEASRYRLVVTATGDVAVDRQVYEDAEAAGVWVNSADDPEHCTAVLPAVWRHGEVHVAVSTGGTSPALASWLRDQVAVAMADGLTPLAELVAEARLAVKAAGRSTESVDWGALLRGPLPGLVRKGRLEEARTLIEKATGLRE
ncbi:MAG: precorrin-2 dehydrogenase/sirohydrochlorin ferrochelatase family protein [Acidimicrobiales bacterium]